MSYVIDPQLNDTMAFLQPQMEGLPPFAAGDTSGWRKRMNAFFNIVNQQIAPTESLEQVDLDIPWEDTHLFARRYLAGRVETQGVVLFVHGGGGVAGSVDQYNNIVGQYVIQSGVDFISLDYGLAPETNGLIQTEQVIAALKWLRENAAELNIDPAKIVLMGDSGGGGIAASAALYARDHLIPIAGLIKIYPMLGYRVTKPSPGITPY